MSTTPTKDQLFALASLGSHGRWRDIEAYLATQIDDAVTAMVVNRDIAFIHECRGKIQALKNLQEAVREAPLSLKKMGLTPPL